MTVQFLSTKFNYCHLKNIQQFLIRSTLLRHMKINSRVFKIQKSHQLMVYGLILIKGF